jgi:peroxiredoxin (alkyl hydroperoxide reductase subunit C)
MPVESRFVHIGDQAPAFTLPSVTGENISLNKFHGNKHVVLVFLRGFL